MSDYLTEQEQIELLKSWLKQYSLVILIGVMIAIAAIASWRYIQQRQEHTITKASNIYDNMLLLSAQHETNAAKKQAETLLTHYSKTIYAEMAALMLGRLEGIQRHTDKAQQHYYWILKHARIPAIRQIARIRLARLFIADQKAMQAISLLAQIDDKNFNGLIFEVQGDAYLALSQPQKARDTYLKALAALPNAEVTRPILQMKYDDLAVAT